MAKVGNVSPTGGASTAIISAVMGDLTPNLTLGQLVAAALSGTEDNVVVDIDLSARTVRVLAAAASGDLPAHGTYGADFTLDDTSKKVAPWTGVGESTVIGLSNATSKPQRSLASMISAVEDAVAAGVLDPDKYMRVFVDQVTGKVRVVSDSDTPDLTAIDAATPLAAFEAPVASTSSTPHGPFE